MPEITQRTIKTNGINMRIAECGSGPLVLLLHGWPESWYSWRHQLPALAGAGYHAVAPDVRGYGGTDKPQPIEAYSMKTLLADYLGLLDAIGERTAVVVGHDWGAPMAWNSAALHPDRYTAVAGMSVPHLGRSPMEPTKLLKAVFGENWFYILYFQEPAKAEAEFEADVRRSMRMILAGSGRVEGSGFTPGQLPKTAKFFDNITEPKALPAWLTEADVDYFTGEFERSGFRGGLNRYRNMDRDWEELPQLGEARINQPALFITGELDPVRSFSNTDTMKALVPNLKELVVPGAGHWIQQERPAEVNEALLSFLKGL